MFPLKTVIRSVALDNILSHPKSFACRRQYSLVLVLELGCVLYTLCLCCVCMEQTPQSREDLLIAGLPPAFCPGSECDWQSGHLLLQLPMCSSPWGAEVSEPFHHCIFVSCLPSVCAVPRSGFYACQAHSSNVGKTTGSLGLGSLCFAQQCCSVAVRHMHPGTCGTLQITGTAMRCSCALLDTCIQGAAALQRSSESVLPV